MRLSGSRRRLRLLSFGGLTRVCRHAHFRRLRRPRRLHLLIALFIAAMRIAALCRDVRSSDPNPKIMLR